MASDGRARPVQRHCSHADPDRPATRRSRRHDLGRARAGPVDLDDPRSRTKNGGAHLVPLSPQAQAILSVCPQFDESVLVFPGLRGPFNGFGKAKVTLDKASGVKDWRLHDLRRTAATGLQKLGVRLEVTEAILNHVSGSRAESSASTSGTTGPMRNAPPWQPGARMSPRSSTDARRTTMSCRCRCRAAEMGDDGELYEILLKLGQQLPMHHQKNSSAH